MTIALDILTGLGLAIACGVRPFLPTLVFGAMAAANAIVNMSGTDASFLESPVWLLVIAVLFVASLLLHGYVAKPGGALALTWVARALGALLFVGAMAEDSAASWGWLVAGVAVVWLTQLAVGETLKGAAARLQQGDQGGLPVYLEIVAGLAAALAIVAPPVSLIYVAFLARLGLARRKREGEKYAGLRSLR
jgi:hypothetical protein